MLDINNLKSTDIMVSNKTVKRVFAFQSLVVILMMVAYVVNFVKFIENDFEAPYKSEIVNGIGVFIPPLASITVWF